VVVNADSSREFAETVVRTLHDAGYQALWAGGCVRDLLLKRIPKDYDVATNARPEQVRELFGRRKTLAVGESFGVIVVLGPPSAGQVEVATFRTDLHYMDGRRPSGVEFTSPEEDAKRRDFTINGMFYDPLNRQILDYVGGQHDLAAGIVRAIGNPVERMTEDKLRMLRAVRFAATFDFELDDATADAVRSMAADITVVSAERIAQEFHRMLLDPHRHRSIQLCQDVDLLVRILPELHPVTLSVELWDRLLHLLRLLNSPDFPMAFAALLEPLAWLHSRPPEPVDDVAGNVGRRLRLSNREIDDTTWLLAHRTSLDGAATQTPSRLKRVLGHPLAVPLVALLHARRVAAEQNPEDALFSEDFLRRTPREELDPPVLLTGTDLIAAGLRPGPQFRDILEAVRDAQLDGTLSGREDALTMAMRLARGNARGDA